MTKAKFQGNNVAINFDELPKTIRDAIRVTVGLGYSYLWVDSLCIFQDDESDQAREIAKMPLIYRNAIITIVAAMASSSSEGFLSQRTTKSPTIENIRITDVRGKFYKARMVEVDSSKLGVLPLDTRAWALQESLLSARTLKYCPL